MSSINSNKNEVYGDLSLLNELYTIADEVEAKEHTEFTLLGEFFEAIGNLCSSSDDEDFQKYELNFIDLKDYSITCDTTKCFRLANKIRYTTNQLRDYVSPETLSTALSSSTELSNPSKPPDLAIDEDALYENDTFEPVEPEEEPKKEPMFPILTPKTPATVTPPEQRKSTSNIVPLPPIGKKQTKA